VIEKEKSQKRGGEEIRRKKKSSQLRRHQPLWKKVTMDELLRFFCYLNSDKGLFFCYK
jgi:hypothetical protein